MEKQNNKRKLLFIFLVAFFITFFTAKVHSDSANTTLVLDDNGFSTDTLTIAKGTTVTWKIEGKNAHWPASDPHPLHTAYPDSGGCIGSKLDACMPLKPGEKYSFKFDHVGSWGMHDHLFHANTMKVVVENKTITSFLSPPIQKNKITPGIIDPVLSAKNQALTINKNCNRDQVCYMAQIESITKKKGYIFAFDVIDELKKTDLSVASNCHRLAHGIGWTAYEVDPLHWKENLRKISPDCSWGALHGIVEQYVANHNKLDSATIKSLCNGDGACNHGIGHMLLVQTENVLPAALEDCSVLTANGDRHMCMTGVFMERMTLQNLVNKDNDSPDRRKEYFKDHLSDFEKLCESLKTTEHDACWEEIARPAVVNLEGDPQKVFAVCAKSSSETGAEYCRRRAVSEIISSKKFDMIGMKYMCELAPSDDTTFPRDCYLRMANLALASLPKDEKNRVWEYCVTIPKDYVKACEDLTSGISIENSIVLNSLN